MTEWAPKAIEDANVFFDRDMVNKLLEIRPPVELFRLPYKICYLELQPEKFPGRIGVLLRDCIDNIEGLIFYTTETKSGHFWDVAGSFVFHIEPEDVELKCLPHASFDLINSVFAHTCFYFSLINCKNVHTEVHSTNKKTERLRKKESGSSGSKTNYRTIYITPHNNSHSSSRTAQGKPVRAHLRRGHFRQYRTGKFCWVQPCQVGSPGNCSDSRTYMLSASWSESQGGGHAKH